VLSLPSSEANTALSLMVEVSICGFGIFGIRERVVMRQILA
jgi:hypothetical protein